MDLIPIEWVISRYLPSVGILAAEAGGLKERPRGRIPPLTRHNEAVVLSSVRVGKGSGFLDRSRKSVFRRAVGDGRLEGEELL